MIDRDGSPGAPSADRDVEPADHDETLGTRALRALARPPTCSPTSCAGARARSASSSRARRSSWSRSSRALGSRTAGPDLAERIAPYRAGYTPQQRRELERGWSSGELLGVVTTDALELGIDIGSLDAAICVTFPGTVASLRQMWGRAGRRGRGLAVYVAGEDALDQFFCRHPDEFLDRPVESAILDHENEQIHPAHLLCAAHEGPLAPGDAETLGPRWEAHARARS